MARLMRKVAVIGFIAMNSPLLAGKSDDAPAPPAVHQTAAARPGEARPGAGSLTAAREAAEILAALDPAMRGRVLGAAAALAPAALRP